MPAAVERAARFNKFSAAGSSGYDFYIADAGGAVVLAVKFDLLV